MVIASFPLVYDHGPHLSKTMKKQRWHLAPAEPQLSAALSPITGLDPLVNQILINRGFITPEAASQYVDPQTQILPDPLAEFSDLDICLDLLQEAIAEEIPIVICGDYDADGMTSTALLLRTFRHLGAIAHYQIPSRMKDGYGINNRIVTECAENHVGIILTVDNGISALEPIALARELGIDVIITDHHDLPETLPPANAILNPKLLAETSPYWGLAGVGVAYILALALAKQLGQEQDLGDQLLELFTLGTIADLAPLTGVNRRWLKQGLKKLPHSTIPGIQALIQLGGVKDNQKQLQPDDIGFRLGPRINAIGRLDNPEVVIELLTTEEPGLALEKAMVCEAVNKERQNLCTEIEAEAIALVEQTPIPYLSDRVLVLLKDQWHHGVIGIVASRLVERYGVPVFICTYEDGGHIRGSARGIPEFNIYDALHHCHYHLGKYGGHKAAGGFSLAVENFEAFRQGLRDFAHGCLQPQHLKPLISVDALAHLHQLTPEFYQQLDSLQPWGIANPEPVFWTPQVRILEQNLLGKDHLRCIVCDGQGEDAPRMKAIAWRWGEYLPLPPVVDIAYKLQENHWQGVTSLQLELVGVRSPETTPEPLAPSPVIANPEPLPKKAAFYFGKRTYCCVLEAQELRIRNDQGKVLAVQKGDRQGLLGMSRHTAETVDVTRSPYYDIVKAALAALEGQHIP